MTESRRISLLLVAATVVALSVSSCGQPRSEQESQKTSSGEFRRTVVVTKVVSQILDREVKLPADLLAFQDVMIYPRVSGFIDWIGVDRGSAVKSGDLLIKMTAPELPAETKESVQQSKAAGEDASQVAKEVEVAKRQLEAAQAKAKASTDTYERQKSAAAAYAGIIAGNELEIAEKTAQSDAATVQSLAKKVDSIEAQLGAAQKRQKAATQAAVSKTVLQSYLQLRAPFDGVITERNVHTGSFVHPPAADTTSTPLLRLQQLSLLRLVVPVPEADVGSIVPGAEVKFTVTAFPGEIFTGAIRRVAEAVDLNTRSMPVEMNVLNNQSRRLTPGMFAEVLWPVRRTEPTLFVPQSAVVKNTYRTFVIRVRNGNTEWIDVKPVFSTDDQVEVFGDLQPGDEVVVRATDELRAGTRVSAKLAPEQATR